MSLPTGSAAGLRMDRPVHETALLEQQNASVQQQMDRPVQETAPLEQQNASLQQQIQLEQHKNAALQQQIIRLEQDNKQLSGSLQHLRGWSATLSRFPQSRYHPDLMKPPRRIYVGSLPFDTKDADLRQFINRLMSDRGATIYEGAPVTACKVYPEKNYAFVEFRNVEEASNLMAFDGLVFKDCYLRIRRPNNYDVNVAASLGPTEPNPTINLTELDMVKTIVQDSPNKLFIGGLPCEWTEDQVKNELKPFGRLKAFNLVMDKNTGKSKGYAFCEYMDSNVTNRVITELKQRSINKRPLTVNLALPDLTQPPQSRAPQSEATHATLQQGVPELSTQSMTPGAAQPQTRPQSMPQSMPQSQAQLSMQSMVQGTPQSQHSLQSMTQGLPQPQHSAQGMTQGIPRPQHSMQSMTQGLPQQQHSMQSMAPGMYPQSQLRAKLPVTSHPGPIQSPQMAAQGTRPSQGGYYTQLRPYPRGTQAQYRPSGGNPQH